MKKSTSLKWLVGAILAVWLVSVAQIMAQEEAAQPQPNPAKADNGVSEVGAVDEKKDRSLLDLLSAGGTIMYPLVLCSILGVTFALLRGFEYRQSVLFPGSFFERLKQKINGSDGSPAKGIEYCDDLIQSDRYLAYSARMCRAGLKKVEEGPVEVEKAVENAGMMEVDRLRRGLRGMQVIIAVAPLLGLVGTVYGMIGAFQSMESAGVSVDKVEMLSKGIYEALVTTATGLTIAIPLLVIHHVLKNKVDALAEGFNGLALQFMEICPSGGGEAKKVGPEVEIAKEDSEQEEPVIA